MVARRGGWRDPAEIEKTEARNTASAPVTQFAETRPVSDAESFMPLDRIYFLACGLSRGGCGRRVAHQLQLHLKSCGVGLDVVSSTKVPFEVPLRTGRRTI